MITKKRKRKFNTTFFSKNKHHIVYRKRPPRIVNRTVPKIIAISVHTVNRFPITSYQVSDHLAKRFRGEGFQKSTNQKQELPVAAMFVNGSERNEQSLQRTTHICFLQSFDSFDQAVSEEKNFNKQLRQERMIRPSSTFIQYL